MAGRSAAPSGVGPANMHSSSASSWQRPWETMRDRATYAMSFASAFVTDAFIDLSRIFLHSLNNGEAHNPPAPCADGTIRLDDVYHLHQIAQGAHAAVAQKAGALSPRSRRVVQHSLGACTAVSTLTLVVVHLTFVSPLWQEGAAEALSRAVQEAGEWDMQVSATCNVSEAVEEATPPQVGNLTTHGPTVVRLEVLNASWPQEWLRPHVLWLQEAAAAARSRSEAAEMQQRAGLPVNVTSVAQNIGSILLPRLSDMAVWAYDVAFPTPRYDVLYGGDSMAWLEVQSAKARKALGIRLVELQLSARDPKYFGPQWTRELLSALRLYDLYVLHSLPLQFARAGFLPNGTNIDFNTSSRPKLYASIVGGTPKGLDLAATTFFASSAVKSGLPWLFWRCCRALSACGTLTLGCIPALLLSAFLRRFAVLTVRMQVYSFYTVRQMRRYAFIAEPLRRLNRYSSGELLELWTAWAACLGLALWLLLQALCSGGAWVVALLCYALAEYWGVVHVRTLQSRWLFPRVMLVLQSGALVYALWWPHCPAWILVWSLLSAQLWLMFTLFCNFDCFATLPEQAPHRLLYRSLLLPAVPLFREHPPSASGEPAREEKALLSSSCAGRFGDQSVARLRSVRKIMVSRGTQTEERGSATKAEGHSVPARRASARRPAGLDSSGPQAGRRETVTIAL